MRLVFIDGSLPALLGLAIGIAASLTVTRLIASVLYRTSPSRCQRVPLANRNAADLGDRNLPISGLASLPDRGNVRPAG